MIHLCAWKDAIDVIFIIPIIYYIMMIWSSIYEYYLDNIMLLSYRCLQKLGFSHQWVSLIMQSVKMVSYGILINGAPMERFNPTRGIRQDNPLSPYLFLKHGIYVALEWIYYKHQPVAKPFSFLLLHWWSLCSFWEIKAIFLFWLQVTID